MTTDNRTTEPTEEQLEAAAAAVFEAQGFDDWGVANRDEREDAIDIARAALVAAQGAAPQAAKSTYISPSLPGIIRNLWKSDPSENSVRTVLKLAGDLIQELIDLKAAPPLPSSGVDEDKLAEVILAAEYAYRDAEFRGVRVIGTLAQFQARSVAEWLKGQVRSE